MADALEQSPQVGLTPLSRLSSRELEVLKLASTGSTNREIGVRLALSVHAVKFRLASAYRKLGVANRTEATSVLLTTHNSVAELRKQLD